MLIVAALEPIAMYRSLWSWLGCSYLFIMKWRTIFRSNCAHYWAILNIKTLYLTRRPNFNVVLPPYGMAKIEIDSLLFGSRFVIGIKSILNIFVGASKGAILVRTIHTLCSSLFPIFDCIHQFGNKFRYQLSCAFHSTWVTDCAYFVCQVAWIDNKWTIKLRTFFKRLVPRL